MKFIIPVVLATLLVACSDDEPVQVIEPTTNYVEQSQANAPAPVQVQEDDTNYDGGDMLTGAIGGMLLGNMLSGNDTRTERVIERQTVYRDRPVKKQKLKAVKTKPKRSILKKSRRSSSFSSRRSSSRRR